MLQKIRKSMKDSIKPAELALFAAVIVYTIVFSYVTILKYQAFDSYAWDLGIFNQSLWSTVKGGKFFYYTAELFLNPSGSFFGIHFSPILILLLPIYSLSPIPETLLVVQSIAIALGAIPMYLLAKKVLNNRSLSLVFGLAYLLYPAIHGINWSDVHVEMFIPLFTLMTIYFIEKGKMKLTLIFTLLTLMTIESASLVVIAIGMYYLTKYGIASISLMKKREKWLDRKIIMPLIMIFIATLWSFFARAMIQFFNPVQIQGLTVESWWSILGISDPIHQPWVLLQALIHFDRVLAALSFDSLPKLRYFLILFGSFMFLPFLNPTTLLFVIPFLSLSLLSNYPPLYRVTLQLQAFIIPLIFLAAVYGARNLLKYRLFSSKIVKVGVLSCSILFFTFTSVLGPFSYYYYGTNMIPTISEHDMTLNEIINMLPPNASVLTQNSIFPHISGRLSSYVIPIKPPQWELKYDEFFEFILNISKPKYVLIDTKSDLASNPGIFETIARLEKDSSYKILASSDGILLYKKT